VTEVADLSPTDASNTAVTGNSLDGNIANMANMDNTLQAVLGMFGRWTSSDTIASAATTDIGAQAESYLTVSGTTTITAFGTVRAGTVRYLRFSGTLTLTYNATSLILPGGASIETSAGDTSIFVSEGSGNWRCISYHRANAQPIRAQVWEYIGTSNPSGATTATFTGLSAYRFLRASFYLTVSVDNETLYLQTSVGGTFATSGADYENQYTTSSGASVGTVNGTTFGFRLSAGGVGNASPESLSGTFHVFELNQARQATHTVNAFGLNPSNTLVHHTATGRRLDTSARDGVRVVPGSGTITGTVVLEGLRG
jgi:hypothetical protein